MLNRLGPLRSRALRSSALRSRALMSRALMSRALRSKGVDEMPLIDEQPLMSSQNIYRMRVPEKLKKKTGDIFIKN